MKQRAFLMLIFAAVLAGGAVWLAKDWLESQIQPVAANEQAVPLTKVVVARVKLSFGNRLQRQHLTEVDWPAGNVPPGSFNSIDKLLEGEKERVVLRAIEPSEPVLASKLTGPGGRATLSTLISKDMRAVTIRVNDVNGVAGFIMPNDHVDILLTRNEDNKKNDPITTILLQNVKVLGIDQDAKEDKEKPSVAKAVTLEVTPRQSQKLALASRVGSLSLALRNLANAVAARHRTITVADLKVGEANLPKKLKTKKVKKRKKRVVVKRRPKPNRFASVTVVRGLDPSTFQVIEEKMAPMRYYRAYRGVPGEPLRLIPDRPQTSDTRSGTDSSAGASNANAEQAESKQTLSGVESKPAVPGFQPATSPPVERRPMEKIGGDGFTKVMPSGPPLDLSMRDNQE
jgi:pilus assembly protein CpaB